MKEIKSDVSCSKWKFYDSNSSVHSSWKFTTSVQSQLFVCCLAWNEFCHGLFENVGANKRMVTLYRNEIFAQFVPRSLRFIGGTPNKNAVVTHFPLRLSAGALRVLTSGATGLSTANGAVAQFTKELFTTIFNTRNCSSWISTSSNLILLPLFPGNITSWELQGPKIAGF